MKKSWIYFVLCILYLFTQSVITNAQEADSRLLEKAELHLDNGEIEEARAAIELYRAEAQEEERLRAEEASIERKRDFVFFTLFIFTLLTIIIIVVREMGRWQKENFEQQLSQINDEKERLGELLQEKSMTPALAASPTRNILRSRLEILNKFFTASITDNPAEYKKLHREVAGLIADRQDFIESTRLAFAQSHPKFIAHLQERGLSQWEINYCCLYALGLRGKEIGDYIRMKSHFNQSLAIRKKLGIEGMKLNTYISQLLQEEL